MATETAVDVVMPQMGVSVSEGTITKWLKNEGEHVEADEPLLEISTDKVDTEVPSPGSGTLTQILVAEGETVDVGTRLAVIGGAPGGEGEAPPEPATAAAAQESAQASDADAAPASAATTEAEPAATPAAETTPAPAPAAPAPAAPAAAPSGNGKSFVSPVVARIAGEHGVDVGSVPGTGRGGRVTKKDILAFVETGGQAQAAPATPAAPAAPAPAAPTAPAAPPHPHPRLRSRSRPPSPGNRSSR